MQILSGIFEGKTTGTPISLLIYNEDMRSKDYKNIKDKFRPGHVDFTYFKIELEITEVVVDLQQERLLLEYGSVIAKKVLKINWEKNLRFQVL